MGTKFSIIIPVYNVEPYLRECLDSILAQTVNDPTLPSYAAASWEAICVDDGSTDISGAILDEYAARDSRFRVIHKENGRVASARNAALDVAKGELLLFVDPDDLISKNTLEQIFEKYLAKKFDLARFPFARVDDDGKNPTKASLDGEWYRTNLWQIAYRRDLIKDVRFRDYVIGEDRLYFLEAFDRAQDLIEVDGVTYFNRQRKGSATRSVMTIRKMVDDVLHDIDMLRIIDRKHRLYPRAFVENLVWGITELAASHFRQLSKDDKSIAWSRWRQIMQDTADIRSIPIWSKVVLLVASHWFSMWSCENLFFFCFRIRYNRFVRAICMA